MAWKDWGLPNKVIVAVCSVVAIAVLVTFAVIALRPDPVPPEKSPSTVGPASSSSPSPSYQCTTATGPDCTKDLADKEAARDKAHADSERTMRTFYAELVKARKAGGAQGRLPVELEAVVAEELKEEILDGLETIKLQKIYYVGETKLPSVRLADDSPEWPDTSVSYQLCVDSRNLNGLKLGNDEYVRSGILADTTIGVVKDSDNWQVASIDSKEVERC